MSSDSVVKHLRTEALMDDLMELQGAIGLGSFLQDLQTLWRRFRARITVTRLTDLVGISPEVMEEQIVTGHKDLS